VEIEPVMTTEADIETPHSGPMPIAWPAIGVATAVTATFLLLYGQTLSELLADWSRSGEYGHGFLLLPIALWLAWKGSLEKPRPSPLWGLIALVATVSLFLLGSIAAEFFTRRIAVLGSLAGLTVYYAGF
jgi:hypothetical protein